MVQKHKKIIKFNGCKINLTENNFIFKILIAEHKTNNIDLITQLV